MLFNKYNLTVAKMASKSEIKPALASVMFTNTKTVATDGARLLEVSVDSELKLEQAPEVAGRKPMRGVKPFLVPASKVKEIKLPVKPVVAEAGVVSVLHRDDKRVELGVGMDDVITTVPVTDEFPQYEQIFPTGKPVLELAVNGRLLAEMLEMMAKLGSVERVNIQLYGGEKPIVLTASNGHQTARGLVMPMMR